MTADTPMVRMYRAPNATEAAMLVHRLESDGIPARQVGGAMTLLWGELGDDALIVEVWVPPDRVAEARASIQSYYAELDEEQPEAPSPPWTCSVCEELNEPSFQVCWSCLATRSG